MANLAQLRTILRRRVQDVPGEVWSDADMNDLLIHGLQRLEIDVLKVDPEAFIRVDQASIVANQAEYEKPSNMLHEVALLKLNPDTGRYQRVPRKDYDFILDREDGELVYCHSGSHIILSPTPTTNQSAGLRMVHVPALTLGSDSVIPPMPLPLHLAITMYAELFASGEVGAGEEEQPQLTGLRSIVDSIPSFYRKHATDNDQISIDLGGLKD